MKLLRYGPPGQEKPGLLDDAGVIRDLSGVVGDLAGDVLRRASMDRLHEQDIRMGDMLRDKADMTVPANQQALAELDLPSTESAIRRRAIYRASILEGKSVLEMGRGGLAAVEELKQLINEVITHEHH